MCWRTDKPLRVLISDVYVDGKNVGIRGRVAQGFLKAGESVVVLPLGDTATVSSLDQIHALPADVSADRHKYAIAGEIVDLKLSGIDSVRLSIGSILSRPAVQAQPLVRNHCRVKIVVMEELVTPIIRGSQMLFHIQSLDIPCVITKLITSTKNSTNKTIKSPRALTAASSALVELRLSDRICIEPFNQCRALGRFVLRRSGETIAVGVIDAVL